ncbi:MAG: type II toxin-antitoxin system VapC family toxin [Chloroflexi bacterium]|nr:type II toxin-antitoxin system VapC family toxin [Chloroflexota bacterium]
MASDQRIDRLMRRLQPHAIIGLDTVVFIYHFEAHPAYSPLTMAALSRIQEGHQQGVTSTITLMELTMRPWQLAREAVAHHYETLLVNFPNLRLVDIDRQVARRAAQLRARYRVRPADALQIAAALVHGAGAFLTNDHRLSRLNPIIDIIQLDG